MTITDLLTTRRIPPPPLANRVFDAGDAGLRLNAHDLLTSLLGVRSRTRAMRSPRAHIRLSVYLPDGRSAVAINLGAASASR